jgi:hypothetical protein
MNRSARPLHQGPALVALTLAPSVVRQEPDVDATDPEPQPAITFLVEAFADHDLVALSEAHDSATEHEFLQDLLRDTRFQAVCRDIVVEFASARYQDTLDRYVAGEDVAFEALASVWRDTPVSPYQTWDSPVYASFLATVREVNLGATPRRVVSPIRSAHPGNVARSPVRLPCAVLRGPPPRRELGPSAGFRDALADTEAFSEAYQAELVRRRALFETPR